MKISHIKVIHDRTKPLLEEAKLVKEYQLKFHNFDDINEALLKVSTGTPKAKLL